MLLTHSLPRYLDCVTEALIYISILNDLKVAAKQREVERLVLDILC